MIIIIKFRASCMLPRNALPNLTVMSITPIRCYCIAHQLYIGLLMIRTCRVVTLVVRGLEMSPANHTYLVGHPAISTYRNQPLFSNSRILGKCVSSAIVAERYTATCIYIRHFDSFLLLQLNSTQLNRRLRTQVSDTSMSASLIT